MFTGGTHSFTPCRACCRCCRVRLVPVDRAVAPPVDLAIEQGFAEGPQGD
jgi:hypothetical protein